MNEGFKNFKFKSVMSFFIDCNFAMQCIYYVVIFRLCCTPLLCIHRLPCCRSVVNVLQCIQTRMGGAKNRVFPYCFFLMRSSHHNNNIHGILEHGTRPSHNKLRPEVLTPLIRSSYDEAKCWTNHWLQ